MDNRCSVCGRDAKYHTVASWAICEKISGRWIVKYGPINGSKCYAIRLFQNHLLAGMGTLRKTSA